MIKESLLTIKNINLDHFSLDFDQSTNVIYLKVEMEGVELKKIKNNIEISSPTQELCRQQTYVLYIKENIQLTEPIELMLSESTKDSAFALLIQAGENSKATVIQKFENKSRQLILCDQQIQVENNAELRLIVVQNLNDDSVLFEWHESFVKTGAEFKYFNFQIGGGAIYSDLLQNSDAPQALLKSDILCRGHRDQNFTLKAEHIYSHKNSKGEINVRGAALEESKIDIQGSVHITPTGSGCEGYLQQNCLLLNPKAQIKATPALKVDTNDVKAGHGAAISNLNEDSIFYMASRGISTANAKQLLLNAFLKEVLDKISDLPELKEEIEKLI